MKKLIKIPYYFLVVGVGVIGLLLLATLIPIPGNFKVKVVKSGSMEPTIMTGGIVVIKPDSSYGMGDIITFGPDTKTQIPTTHRIVEVSGEGKIFQTKGDANDAPDPTTIKLSDVEGKVIFSAPYLGYLLDFARKPMGFVLLVGIPAALVIFDELMNIFQEIRKMRRKSQTKVPPRVLDLRVRPKTQPEKGNYNFSFKSFALFLIVLGPIFGLSKIGSTVSYYRENESSVGNAMRAGESFPNTEPEIVVESFAAPEALVIAPEPDIITTPEEELTESVITQDNMNDEVIVDGEGEVKKEPVEGEEVTEGMPAEGAAPADAEVPTEETPAE